MNNLKEYIIEKLRINKDIKVNSNDDIYIAVYSDNGKAVIKSFNSYEEAREFTKDTKLYYYDGYKIPKELEEEMSVLLKNALEGGRYTTILLNFVKKNKLERIWNSLLSLII